MFKWVVLGLGLFWLAPLFAQSPPPEPVEAEIRAKLEALPTEAGVDESVRERVAANYNGALGDIAEARRLTSEREGFEQAAAAAPEALEAVRDQLASTPQVLAPDPKSPLADLERQLAEQRAELAQARGELADLEPEPARREERRSAIPGRLAQLSAELDKASGEYQTPAPESEPERLTESRRWASAARWHLANARQQKLEAELAAIETERELLVARIQRLNRDIPVLEKREAKWTAAVLAKRESEAQDVAAKKNEQAEEAAAQHPFLGRIADRIATLAAVRKGAQAPRNRTDRLERRALEIAAASRTLNQRVSIAEERSKSLGGVKENAAVLRAERRLLTIDKWRNDLGKVRREVSDAQTLLIEYQNRLAKFGDLDALIDPLIEEARETALEAGTPITADRAAALRVDAKQLLGEERQLLEQLSTELNRQISEGLAVQRGLLSMLDVGIRYDASLVKRLIWNRSEEALGPKGLGEALDELRAKVLSGDWLELAGRLARSPIEHPFQLLVVILVTVVLLGTRKRIRTRVQDLGKRVSSWQTDSFGLTVAAVLLMMVNSASYPAILLLVGWVLAWIPESIPPAIDLVEACVETSIAWFTINLVRRFVRPGGICDVHFRWPSASLKAIYRHTHWLMVAAVPLYFVFVALRSDELTPLTRIMFVIVMVLISFWFGVVLRPTGAVLGAILRKRPDGWLKRLRYFWYGPAVLYPLVLAGLSIAGYSFAALRFHEGFARTMELIIGLILFRALVLRWLFIARRRVALEQAKKRAAKKRDPNPREVEHVGTTESAESHDLQLTQIDQQTRGLLRTIIGFTFLFGIWLIWRDLLPALQALDTLVVWGSDPEVSLSDVLTASLVAIVTVLAAKNLPGSIQIAILDRLPMRPGSRYALTTVCTYLIIGVGVALTLSRLGLGWDRVQWLVAAMGVGLGFGLQEIFANFVSGLIILFEQPVRIGDIVTVGEVQGRVSRIQMRATTIVDYDLREFIVPNKDFITGRLINWTLTDPVTRAVLPVGIAYGSDVQRATDLLLEVARSTQNVLTEPPPHTLFRRFGESSLDLELRVYIPTRESWVQVMNDLHNGVDRAFRQAEVEISFPQRDLHIRTGGFTDRSRDEDSPSASARSRD